MFREDIHVHVHVWDKHTHIQCTCITIHHVCDVCVCMNNEMCIDLTAYVHMLSKGMLWYTETDRKKAFTVYQILITQWWGTSCTNTILRIVHNQVFHMILCTCTCILLYKDMLIWLTS